MRSFSVSRRFSVAEIGLSTTPRFLVATRHFQFTWQHKKLEETAAARNFSNPVWVAQEDERWVTTTVSAPKPGEQPLAVQQVPFRIELFNLTQLDCSALDSTSMPHPIDQHVSWSSSRPYSQNLQFQLEQRIVVHSDAQSATNNNKMDTQEQQQLRHFWITPREAHSQGFRPRRNERPFAVLSNVRKTLLNAEQFVNPAAFETFPINAASARPFSPHQRGPLQAWHAAHLSMLKDSNDKNALSKWSNRLCIFATREQYSELGFSLSTNAVGVATPLFSNPATATKAENETTTTTTATIAQQLRETDLFNVDDIVNQDILWSKSAIAKPEIKNKNDMNRKVDEQNVHEHIVLPRGTGAFSNMQDTLDEAMRNKKFSQPLWVSRKSVKALGLALREGSNAVSSAYRKTDNGNESRLNETTEYFHISQLEKPEEALRKVGMHTR